MSRTKQIVSRFPAFYRSGDGENLFYQFIGVFAGMLDIAEEDLLRLMRTHWVNTADNEGSKGFDATEKGDLDKIFSLYLESLGGTVLLKQGTRRSGEDGLKDDALYRTRILGLIQVLKNGASTKSGIVDIVAANLGILPDLPYAQQAKSSIEIIEFLPEFSSSLSGVLVELFTDILLSNSSPVPVIPEFRLHFLKSFPVPLLNPRISVPQTGAEIRFIGAVNPDDDLYFLSDGSGLHRGQPFTPQGSLTLLPGNSQVQLKAEVGLPAGEFNNTVFDFAQFDQAKVQSIGIFNETKFDQTVFSYDIPVAELEVRYQRLYPGSFMVRTPWDIPGFSVNIILSQRSMERMAIFGVPQSTIDKIAGLVNKEFELLEDFYAALAPLVETEDLLIALNTNVIEQLAVFPGAKNLTTKLSLLLGAAPLLQFNTLSDFFQALPGLVDADKQILYRAFGLLLHPDLPMHTALRESEYPDKFTRFNISPRGQIKSIVNRVKAAGVYAVIAFEKRFGEDQQLGETFGFILAPNPENQKMSEANFDIASTQTDSLTHNLTDRFHTSGVFDYTRFGTLNRFA